MHRTQILLEEWQYELLKAKAEREGQSMSEILRDLVAEALGGKRRPGDQRALNSIAGIVNEPGLSGRDHDDVLYGPRRGRP